MLSVGLTTVTTDKNEGKVGVDATAFVPVLKLITYSEAPTKTLAILLFVAFA